MEWALPFFGGLVVAVVAILLWSRRKSEPKQDHNPFSLIQQQLDGIREQFQQQLTNQHSLLEKTHGTIGSRLDNAAKVVGELSSRMIRVEEVNRQVLEASKDIASLQQILRAPKLRGNFSELQLGDLLAQIMPTEHFQMQYTFANGERVDAVVHTAQGMVPIDAKFPLENFERLVAATTDEDKKNFRKQFVGDVRKHIDDIAKKYILPNEGTFEFALMYIPAENVYYEIVTRDIASGENFSIMNHALKKRVIPVSPNTFYAYLNTILLGLRGMQVEKRAKEIFAELAGLRKVCETLGENFGVLGKHIRNSQGSYEVVEKGISKINDKLERLSSAAGPVEVEDAEVAKVVILSGALSGGAKDPVATVDSSLRSE